MQKVPTRKHKFNNMSATWMRTKTMAWLLGFLCLLCLAAMAQANTSGKAGKGAEKGAGTSPALAKDVAHMHKTKRQQQDRRLGLGTAPLTAVKQPKQLARSAHGLNKKLLSQMGFMKVKAPNSHNRKRLAVESRRHAARDDSHMFIIKLPPNMHYYAGPAAKNAVPQSDHHLHHHQQESRVEATSGGNAPINNNKAQVGTATGTNTLDTEASALKANGKKVSFPFSSNGRPGRIYHWNLPVLKQALAKKPHFAHVSAADRNRLLDIESVPTWRHPWENETAEKGFSAGGGKSKYRKSLKPKSPTYYAPSQAVSKQSFHKYFAGNGKPKGFYVIKEHQSKPQFYQNIIS